MSAVRDDDGRGGSQATDFPTFKAVKLHFNESTASF